MKSQHEINEKMRSITVDWLLEVHNRFKLMPETLYLTINILDRYLSSTDIPKKELQLVGISSMLIACKYEEIYPPQVALPPYSLHFFLLPLNSLSIVGNCR